MLTRRGLLMSAIAAACGGVLGLPLPRPAFGMGKANLFRLAMLKYGGGWDGYAPVPDEGVCHSNVGGTIRTVGAASG